MSRPPFFTNRCCRLVSNPVATCVRQQQPPPQVPEQAQPQPHLVGSEAAKELLVDWWVVAAELTAQKNREAAVRFCDCAVLPKCLTDSGAGRLPSADSARLGVDALARLSVRHGD